VRNLKALDKIQNNLVVVIAGPMEHRSLLMQYSKNLFPTMAETNAVSEMLQFEKIPKALVNPKK
jgi:hypothetical protein